MGGTSVLTWCGVLQRLAAVLRGCRQVVTPVFSKVEIIWTRVRCAG